MSILDTIQSHSVSDGLIVHGYPDAMAATTSPLSWLRPVHPSVHTHQTSGRQPITTKATDPSTISKVLNGFLYLRDGLTPEQRESVRLCEERKQMLNARMENAESYRTWYSAARELDIVEGNNMWKEDATCTEINKELLEERMRQLDEARESADTRAMMHLVRTALARDLGGMGNIELYRHCHVGTKKVVENYVSSALRTIATLVEHAETYSGDDEWGPKAILDEILFSRQSFGRSALLLSGGGTFGMSHIGVIKAMNEARLLPRIISGASAGSIVCAVVCTQTDDELPQLMKDFPYGDLAVFDEEGNEDTIIDHVLRLLTKGNWSDIKHLTRVMQDMLGDMTFQEAYNRTRRICNITVSSASIYELPRLLNYITSPNVMIWSAVAASCSVPLVFSAAHLLVKDPHTGEQYPWDLTPQGWIDGSVDNDLPMTRLAEMFNVNHFIVSQVNPHVAPFLAREDANGASHRQQNGSMEEPAWLYTLTASAKSEALHRMQVLGELGFFPNLVSKLQAVLSQKYSGDINIFPAIGVFDLPRILKNPTPPFMERMGLLGERGTWPLLSRIRDRCAIEMALDNAALQIRTRVVFSKSQVDLRRAITGRGRAGSHDLSLVTGSGAGRGRGQGLPTRSKDSGFMKQLDVGGAVGLGGGNRRRVVSGVTLAIPGVDADTGEWRDTDEDVDGDENSDDDGERLEMVVRESKKSRGLKSKREATRRVVPRNNILVPALQLSPIRTRGNGGFERDASKRGDGAGMMAQSAMLPPKGYGEGLLNTGASGGVRFGGGEASLAPGTNARTVFTGMGAGKAVKSGGGGGIMPDIVVDDTASMTSPQVSLRREASEESSDATSSNSASTTSVEEDEYDEKHGGNKDGNGPPSNHGEDSKVDVDMKAEEERDEHDGPLFLPAGTSKSTIAERRDQLTGPGGEGLFGRAWLTNDSRAMNPTHDGESVFRRASVRVQGGGGLAGLGNNRGDLSPGTVDEGRQFFSLVE